MHHRAAALAAALLLSFSGVGAQGADMGFGGNMKTPSYQDQIYTPWSHGKNNPAIDKGLEFTVPEVDNLPDFHGSIDNPQFVIFAGGNYFFVMAPWWRPLRRSTRISRARSITKPCRQAS